MLLNVEAGPIVLQARAAASHAARTSGVQIADENGRDKLRDVADLFVSVWGTTKEAAPIPFDLLRSLSHAGCSVAAAYDTDGVLCGAAVAVIGTEKASLYSLIAGVRPGVTNAGVGFALKQHQRAWALERGFDTIRWTFDPLVSRNARFNLTKLGGHVAEYIQDFYGPMDDVINGNDETDRLVAMWPLASDRAVECSLGNAEAIDLPQFSRDAERITGPDDELMVAEHDGSLWCRVPNDIVELRASSPPLARQWRVQAREFFTDAFAGGFVADGVTRTGWYRLTTGGQA